MELVRLPQDFVQSRIKFLIQVNCRAKVFNFLELIKKEQFKTYIRILFIYLIYLCTNHHNIFHFCLNCCHVRP